MKKLKNKTVSCNTKTITIITKLIAALLTEMHQLTIMKCKAKKIYSIRSLT